MISVKIKIHYFILLLFLLPLEFPSVIGAPPDKPLKPKEWIQKMGNGNWMIFNIKPDRFTFADVNYNPNSLDSLISIGQTGGRLHFRPRDILDTTTFTYDTAAISFLSRMIDDMTDRDMGVCLQYNPLGSEEETSMTERSKKIYFSTWEQLCSAFKDKSHLFAMSPVIETHVWEDLGNKDVMRDSLNWLYDSLTVIFRKYNPTRIISYKPWGAAKKAELHTLNFPFKGNNPNPDSGYYVGSFSGSYGMGNWEDYGIWQQYTLDDLKYQMMHAGKLNKPDFGIQHAVEWREQTGIEVWIDHWEPDKWKNGNWSDEQNLAYTKYLLDTLQTLKIASSGPQTRRFWDNENQRFFEDDFTTSFNTILKKHDWRSTVSVSKNSFQYLPFYELKQNYPNPFNPTTTINYSVKKLSYFTKGRGEVQPNVSLKIYDILGKEVTSLVNKKQPHGNYQVVFNAKNLPSGTYFYQLRAGKYLTTKKMTLTK